MDVCNSVSFSKILIIFAVPGFFISALISVEDFLGISIATNCRIIVTARRS